METGFFGIPGMIHVRTKERPLRTFVHHRINDGRIPRLITPKFQPVVETVGTKKSAS